MAVLRKHCCRYSPLKNLLLIGRTETARKPVWMTTCLAGDAGFSVTPEVPLEKDFGI
jgi:hypothetical protein